MEQSGKFTVLLAEDDPATSILARINLEKLGLGVRLAQNGKEALDIWRSGGFTVALLDFNMPKMSGLDVARAIRAEEASRKDGTRTRIILITAKPLAHLEEQQSRGVVDYMALKPVNYQHIYSMIEDYLPSKSATTAKEAARPDSAKPLDLRELEESAGPDGLRDILELYIRQTEKYIVEIESAISLGDGARVSSIAHKIKGSSAQYTAMALVGPAAFLQNHCASGSVDGAAEKLAAIKSALAEVIKYTENQLDSRK